MNWLKEQPGTENLDAGRATGIYIAGKTLLLGIYSFSFMTPCHSSPPARGGVFWQIHSSAL